MDFRHRAIFTLLALTAFLGCRHNQAAQRELLERELRLQEDRIYELEAKLEDTQRQLQRFGGGTTGSEYCPAPSSTFAAPPSVVVPDVSRPMVSPGTGAPAAPSVRDMLPAPLDTGPPKVELPMDVRKEAAPSFSGAPILSPPDPNKPEGLPGRGAAAPAVLPQSSALPSTTPSLNGPLIKEMSSPKFRSPSQSLRREGAGELRTERGAIAEPAGDLIVTSIALNRRTGGWNADGAAGDDGVFILVEPRNAQGLVVPTAGEVSLVVIDPAIVGEGGRYARWDFTTADAAATYRPAIDGGTAGLHFELPWPAEPPTHSRLKLFVRFTTDDGRRLQAEKDLTIHLAGAAANQLPKSAATMPREFSARSTLPAAAVNIATGSATLAAPTGMSEAAPLKWGGPKAPVGQPQALPTTTATPLPEGPQLGPALLPAGNLR